MVNLLLYISETVTDIYFKQVVVQQHMKEIYSSELKKQLLKHAPMHSSQPHHVRLCGRLLSDCTELNLEISLALLCGSTFRDI